MSYTIEVDVLEAVQDFYPGLSLEDATKIAESIVEKWDYTQMYNNIADDITWYADAFLIDLEGKDGYVEDEPDRFNRDAGSIARQRLVNNNIHVLNPPDSPLFP
tara:strand:+ start:108 stop:419 length:312 start_codon:yes stop_codon:yes gene_type:complete